MVTQEQVSIEARRIAVGEGVLARRSYRSLAEEYGVAVGTIAGDVKALRKEWAKTYGRVDEYFERALMDLDALQAQALAALPGLVGTDRLAVIDRVLKVSDQRNRLLNLYPRPTNADGTDIPTGPIQLTIEMIPAGNRSLIHDGAIEAELAPWKVNDDGHTDE